MDNNEIVDEMLTKIKLAFNITDTSKDELIKLYIELAMQQLLNLTNRYVYIKEMDDLLFKMSRDFYTIYIAGDVGSSQVGDGTNFVKQVSEDGRSVTFGNVGEQSTISYISSIINTQTNLMIKEINSLRLLYKSRPKETSENEEQNG